MIHEPVGCLGQPDMPVFTEEDLENLTEEAYEKLIEVVSRYKARINSQCKINGAHDEIHD